MRLKIDSGFSFSTSQPVTAFLQFEAAATANQAVLSSKTVLEPALENSRIEAQDGLGHRTLLQADGGLSVHYTAEIEINRPARDLNTLESPDLFALPGYVVPYLFETRYCQSQKFASFVDDEFAGSTGGARIAAIHDWIAANFTYEPGASTFDTSALDSFAERRGVCRDYAHVLVSFARASDIPARYVACYAPGVNPPDFHAVAQVFLLDPATGEAGWYLADATGMSTPEKTAIIGVGRDAADVSFLTTFGPSAFGESSVSVSADE